MAQIASFIGIVLIMFLSFSYLLFHSGVPNKTMLPEMQEIVMASGSLTVSDTQTRIFDTYFGIPFDGGLPQGWSGSFYSVSAEVHKVLEENESRSEIERIFMVAPGEYSLLVNADNSESKMIKLDVGNRVIFLSDTPRQKKNYVVIRKRVLRKYWRKQGLFGDTYEEIDNGPFGTFALYHLEVHLHSTKELEYSKQ